MSTQIILYVFFVIANLLQRIAAIQQVSWLPFVQADKIISDSNLDKEYSAIHGDAEFCKLVAQLAFGENSNIVKDGLVSMVYY